jgi:hypothetical protein
MNIAELLRSHRRHIDRRIESGWNRGQERLAAVMGPVTAERTKNSHYRNLGDFSRVSNKSTTRCRSIAGLAAFRTQWRQARS